MSDDVTRRLSVEGVDPLTLAGVNDANLIELSRRLGVRVSLRGDMLTLQGKAEAVEHALPITQALVDLARVGDPVDTHDVERLVLEDGAPPPVGESGEYKIITLRTVPLRQLAPEMWLPLAV